MRYTRLQTSKVLDRKTIFDYIQKEKFCTTSVDEEIADPYFQR